MTSRIKYNSPHTASGAFELPYHYEMVSDKTRIIPLKKAIIKTCKEKRVLECGTGSAVLSIMAVKAGAQKVYAIEKDPIIARFARENIRKNGFESKISLLKKDIMNVTPKDLDNKKLMLLLQKI